MGLFNKGIDKKMEIPQQKNSAESLIYKKYEDIQSLPRLHMGASELGATCERSLWLFFRWAVVKKFEGRILRLFGRGNEAEKRIVSELRGIGFVITNTGDNQVKIDFGSHIGGSLDGIIKSGVPGALNVEHILEIKTHNKKSFDDLYKNGVEKSKPSHYVQMQVYMHGTKIERAFYFAECKDDDRIYTERVKYDKDFAEKYISNGKVIALSDKMPPPISTNPTWFECKMCAAHDFCHVSKKTKEVNCRTCAHSTAKEDGTFFCERWKDVIPESTQRVGCDSHVLHPDLVPWELDSEKSTEITAAYKIGNKIYMNGSEGIKSSQLLKDGFFNDEAQSIIKIFDGELC